MRESTTIEVPLSVLRKHRNDQPHRRELNRTTRSDRRRTADYDESRIYFEQSPNGPPQQLGLNSVPASNLDEAALSLLLKCGISFMQKKADEAIATQRLFKAMNRHKTKPMSNNPQFPSTAMCCDVRGSHKSLGLKDTAKALTISSSWSSTSSSSFSGSRVAQELNPASSFHDASRDPSSSVITDRRPFFSLGEMGSRRILDFDEKSLRSFILPSTASRDYTTGRNRKMRDTISADRKDETHDIVSTPAPSDRNANLGETGVAQGSSGRGESIFTLTPSTATTKKTTPLDSTTTPPPLVVNQQTEYHDDLRDLLDHMEKNVVFIRRGFRDYARSSTNNATKMAELTLMKTKPFTTTYNPDKKI